MSRILCLDYGDRRIGVAISDPLGFTAQPVSVISPSFDELKEILDRYEGITEIVVGLPKTMRGEIGPRAQKTIEYIDFLKTKIDIPIITWDERLTTASAKNVLTEAGLNSRKQRKVIDKVAATIILRSYLDRKKTERT